MAAVYSEKECSLQSNNENLSSEHAKRSAQDVNIDPVSNSKASNARNTGGEMEICPRGPKLKAQDHAEVVGANAAFPPMKIKTEQVEEDECLVVHVDEVEEGDLADIFTSTGDSSERDGSTEACSEDDKIIGGYECSPNSQPWQVYLTYDNGERWCGASVINERWLVSAAHCYVSASRLTVHLGEHNIDIEEGTEQRIGAEKVIPHPDYNDNTTDNDFMLIKLKEPAIFNQYVQPIPLATSCSSEGDQCLVSGWGNQITTGVDYASTLQCLNLPVLSRAQCEGAYGWQITENMFCAGFMEGGKDSCQGDSGGPVVCNGELRGVVSWGYGCAQPGYPGVYAEVCRYTDWVKSTIANN